MEGKKRGKLQVAKVEKFMHAHFYFYLSFRSHTVAPRVFTQIELPHEEKKVCAHSLYQ